MDNNENDPHMFEQVPENYKRINYTHCDLDLMGYQWEDIRTTIHPVVLEDSPESKKAQIDYLNRESQNLPADYHTQFTSLDNQSDYETI